jgi:hypothetical protein
MKTLFRNILQTEKYLQQELTPEDSLVYQARLIVDADLRKDTFFHRMVHKLVRLYHRKKLKAQVETIHENLFNDPAKVHFRERIMKLFNS